MSSLRNNLVHYVDEQIEAILSAPGMWGSNEAVELQLLQLLEFRSVALRPELERRAPRTILDAFQRFLQTEFVDPPPMPLFVLVEEYGRQREFVPLLRKFIGESVAGMEEEDPFRTHDLVLRLRLRAEARVPRASSLSAYYDALRRVLRALARSRGTRGRASHDLEEAIDFAMPDVTVMPANGAPAQVVLPLEQLDRKEAPSVQRALSQIATASSWAADIGSPVGALKERLPQGALSELVAAQTLRLMPSAEADVRSVELGGKLLGQVEPIVLRPAHAGRMVQVLRQETEPHPFDEVGSVRAVDMDQRTLRLRVTSGSVRCWLDTPELIELSRSALGQRVRVKGWLHRAPGSPPVVIVERIEA
jgi:hypothetical protein